MSLSEGYGMKKCLLGLCLLASLTSAPIQSSPASDISSPATDALTAPDKAPGGSGSGRYEPIAPAFGSDSDSPHSDDFDSTSKATRELPAAASQPGGPSSPSSTNFSLIRVAPFSGTNPFDYRNLRRAFAGEGICTPGPLSPPGNLPLLTSSTTFIDVDANTNNLSVRDSGSAAPDTALIITLPAVDTKVFTAGSGWQAVTPSPPGTYGAGPHTVNFVLKRSDSGDFFRLSLGFFSDSMLRINSASGSCCGQGGCP